MNALRDAADIVRAHWRARHRNVWAWILPLGILICAIPPR